MKTFGLAIPTFLGLCGLLKADESGKHLFILSGQSNMARFKPALWFTLNQWKGGKGERSGRG